MSRLKNFPNKVSVGMKADGKLVLLPEKACWEIFTKEQIKKVESYCLPSAQAIPKPKRKKKSESRVREEPDVPELASGADFRCNACGRDIDNPKTAGNGKTQCPHCLKIGTVVGKE